eukprot:625125-Prymnesium_polylepis.1
MQGDGKKPRGCRVVALPAQEAHHRVDVGVAVGRKGERVGVEAAEDPRHTARRDGREGVVVELWR